MRRCAGQQRGLPDACVGDAGSSEFPVILSLRLILPESCTSDAARVDKGAPLREYRTSLEIAIE